MAQFKAISQNLMHNSVTTTDSIYSIFSQEEIKNEIMGLGTQEAIVGDNLIQKLAEMLLLQV